MRITFLGGTEIGASCLWFQTTTVNWLVDAGTRMDDRDPLPSLEPLDGAHIDALFITHAHQDHIGALPLLSAMFPQAPVFMTEATLDLTRIMLADAFKLSQGEGKMAVFSEAQLNDLWTRVQVMGQDKVFGWQGLQVATYTAGHILGAVSLGFVTESEGSVWVSGDYSVTPSRLLPGLRVPRGVLYDTVVTESTYGNRLHGNRAEQEISLASQVSEVLKHDGFVLIPAFAVGRAQEVLTILQDAQHYDRSLPNFPLVVDGLVRSICPIYEAHGELLRGPAKRLLKTKGALFDREDVRFVRRPEERQAVVAGKPACIIASSGMLNGGPSVFYADKLVSHEKNAVLLCGYQDEESPGRRLLNLAEQPETQRRWILPDRVVSVQAQVALYSLSAHADRRELVQTVTQLRPRQVLLVHGDKAAKDALGMELQAVLPKATLQVVALGETVEILPGDRPRNLAPADLEPEERPVQARGWAGQVLVFREKEGDIALGVCQKVLPSACLVHSPTGPTRRIPMGLVVDALGRIPAGEDPQAYLAGLWQAAEICVEENRVWGNRPAERLGSLLAEQSGKWVPADPYGLEAVAEVLSPYGWRKFEIDEKDRVFQVFVDFPWAIPEEVQKEVTSRETQGGWHYEIQPHVYPPAVQRLAEETAADYGVTVGSVKVFPQERRLELPIFGSLTSVEKEEIAFRVQSQVGGTVRGIGGGETRFVPTTETRMEQNTALAHLKQKIPREFELQKAGMDRALGTITLSVAFPDAVRARPETAAFTEQMERETGWQVTWSPSVNQQRLAEVAVALCREAGWTVQKAPSLLLAEKTVRVQGNGKVDPEQARTLGNRFWQQTGWTLVWSGPKPSASMGSERISQAQPDLSFGERMEINRALQHVEARMRAQGIAVYRKSVKGQAIELTFITPEAGAKHREWLEQMSRETGWTVRVAPRVHQQALLALVQELAGSCGLLGNPGVHLEKKEVRVRTERTVPDAVIREFAERTGWKWG